VDEITVTIKGLRDSLLVTLGPGAWDNVTASLMQRIRTQGDFFRGARMAIDVGDRALDRDAIEKLKEKLAKHEVSLWAFLSDAPATVREARRLELETDFQEVAPAGAAEEELPPFEADERGSDGVLVRLTLRSGRVVRHIGHVVVIGDVNPGAQIIAGGDVVVWGRLRGTVHAGAAGDEGAVVCALDLRPMQLRIANTIAITPEDAQSQGRPEVAFIHNGQIVAEEWTPS
jgi:septum site-determining protein MinC